MIFKSIDDKFEELGFIKIRESNYIVIYERYDERYGYTQVLHMSYRKDGCHIIQSYQKTANSSFNANVGIALSMYEAKLCLKKMKRMGWRVNRHIDADTIMKVVTT